VRTLALTMLLLGTFGYNGDTETTWVRFNAPDDEVDVQVGGDLLDPVTIDLWSTTGAVLVGDASVDPGGGPVGTDHGVAVNVLDDWEEVVGRVTVTTRTDDRGEEEHVLRQDSADHGYWHVVLTSVGTEGEQRTDVFDVALLVAEEDEPYVQFDTGEARR